MDDNFVKFWTAQGVEDATLKLFARAGFNITKGSRSYTPCWDDPDIDGRFVRAPK